MANIKILSEETINKISAGEVIERPSSALKELLENSADSGATRIDIEFIEGGKKLLRVTDNGSGMSQEDLSLSILRHGTSKIGKIEDLDTLSTFGFRGEALASLAAVSRLKIQTGMKNQDSGFEITSEGGKISPVSPAPPIEGTQVTVQDLFFNVPARQKFLKSDGGETGALKKVVKAFGLIHPEINISLRQNNKLLSHWARDTFYKRSCQVLNIDPQKAVYVERDLDGIRVEAVLVLPQYNLTSQQGIHIFVQHRPIVDRMIQQAILEGYRNLVLHGQYPQVVLSLQVQSQDVDVNVHPTKAQVKFLDKGLIFRAVSSVIKEELSGQFQSGDMETKSQVVEAHQFNPQVQQTLVKEAVVQYNKRQMPEEKHLPLENPAQSLQPMESSKPEPSQVPGWTHFQEEESTIWSSLDLIGQYANTYLVAQNQNGLVLIDQHAAHERVMFESIKERFLKKGMESQPSLLEEVLPLDPDVVESLTKSESLELLGQLGFEVHSRGPEHLAVTSRPALLLDAPLPALFESLARKVEEVGSASGPVEDKIGDIWASMACHGAIRAGRVLSIDEMKGLLKQMDQYPFSSFCPHGRPVSVAVSLYDIEKLFKRIV